MATDALTLVAFIALMRTVAFFLPRPVTRAASRC
jgi:hypothetical protein